MVDFLGFLYFDTNALIKYLLPQEKGSDVIEFLVNNALNYNHLLYTSQVGFYEIEQILKRKVRQAKGHKDHISKEKYNVLLHRRRRTLKQRFKLIDERKPHIEQKFNHSDIARKTSLRGRDARHWAAILNHLNCFDGVKIVNSDRRFNKFVRNEGFEIINPESISIENLKEILENPHRPRQYHPAKI